MPRVQIIAALAVLAAATPALAQTVSPAPAPKGNDEIIVQGQRKAISDVLRERFSQSKSQLARFEDKVCPTVIGMPRDWTAKLNQMIRDNIIAVGGKVDKPGCNFNATVIFSDQPSEFIKAFAKKEPDYFAMSPRELDQFAAVPRPVASWHVTDIRDRDGQELGSSNKMSDRKRKLFNTYAGMSVAIDARVDRQSAATRLYTNSREDMLVAFVVIDRQKTPGKTLRQLADLSTMHLLLDIKQDSGAKDPTSILSLLEPRPTGASPPMSMSNFDRGIIKGFYTLKENNRTAAQQYSQIAAAIERGTGEK